MFYECLPDSKIRTRPFSDVLVTVLLVVRNARLSYLFLFGTRFPSPAMTN